jgi:hypothetical protein
MRGHARRCALFPSPIRAHVWGATPQERQQEYPCDRQLVEIDQALFRAINVEAPVGVVFRWLCQLRAAPYSYDWIDNFGRKSPRQLVPGMEDLAPGQRVMSIFRLAAYEPDRHLTLVMDAPRALRAFGAVAGTYQVSPRSKRSCRLVAKLVVRYPRSVYGACLRRLLPWGDFIMMRKQLLTLKRLAEQTAASERSPFAINGSLGR